jgi:hypothetical protein
MFKLLIANPRYLNNLIIIGFIQYILYVERNVSRYQTALVCCYDIEAFIYLDWCALNCISS